MIEVLNIKELESNYSSILVFFKLKQKKYSDHPYGRTLNSITVFIADSSKPAML